MFVSERVSLNEFFESHYDNEKNYRLYFDTKENNCVYIDLNLVKVPNFVDYGSMAIPRFQDLMENREWHWRLHPRYVNLYIYLIGDKCYLCDRDNIRINNFQTDYNCLQEKARKMDLPKIGVPVTE